MKVINIIHAAEEAERFLAAVKHWRAAKLMSMSEAERLRAVKD
jgi:hypothetical protein